MSINEVAANQGIRCKDTHNLFWGQYGYSLQYPIPPEWAKDRAHRLQRFWATAKYVDAKEWRRIKPHVDGIHETHQDRVASLVDEIIEKNPHLDDGDFYYQSNDPVGSTRSFITFYLKTEEAAVAMLTNMPNAFTLVSRPPSTDMLKVMKENSDKNIVVRERGWYAADEHAPEGGFTYKVQLTWRYPETKEEVINRVENICFENSLFFKGRSLILYLNTEDDLFLVKIAMSQYISTITRCLITEK